MDRSIADYVVLDRIGEGGLGEVWRARDTKVGRTVALKVLPVSLLEDAARRNRLLEDARAAATLSHPNIATLFDVGDDYLVYEFASGTTLRKQMTGQPMNTRHALELAVQLTDATAEAHAHGVLHTDLRPETIIVTGKGNAKILDFGMAAWTKGGAKRASVTSAATASSADEIVPYLSPEQAIGRPVDARTDVFSLGVIIYEMLTGRNPFAAPNAAETIRNIVRSAPLPASRVNAQLPPDLDSVLLRALAKDVDARHQSAAPIGRHGAIRSDTAG
ncbi:MAG: serine/threonine protein kinase [Acidobacteria bacterium]|nr:serine/threonine protein kinase [Acidobacteriota bacterium]